MGNLMLFKNALTYTLNAHLMSDINKNKFAFNFA